MSEDRAAAWQIATFQKSDTAQPLIQVRYTGDETIHTIAFDNNGGGSTDALLVSIVTGTTTTTFDVDGADETAADIQALVDGINALADWEAKRYNAPADLTINSNDFIDLAASDVPRTFTNFLYQDVSEILTTNLRLSNPQLGDEGLLEIGRIEGQASFASGTMDLTISQDTGDETDEVVVYTDAVTTTATDEVLYDGIASGVPIRVKGPLLCELVGSASQTAAALRIWWRPVN